MTTKRPRAKNSSQPSEPQEPCYNPISYTWQLQQCKKLHLPFVRIMELRTPTASQLLKHRSPSVVIRTDGDGNCLFRCFSLVLTGSDVHHILVRKMIVDHIAHSGKTFSAFFPESFGDDPMKYLSRTEMERPGTWGSDVEILAAAHLLKTRVYVYTLHGNNWQWVEHNLDLTSPESRMHRESIYLMHTGLIHYDLVEEVEPLHHTSRKDKSECDLKSRDRFAVKHKLTECSLLKDDIHIKSKPSEQSLNVSNITSKPSEQSLNVSNNARCSVAVSLAVDEFEFARWLEARRRHGASRQRRRRFFSTEK